MFTNGPGDVGSIPGRVILKTQKMVLDPTFHNIQHYKDEIICMLLVQSWIQIKMKNNQKHLL